MILIIGGAYQGKLDFAKEAFGVTDGDVCCCDASRSVPAATPILWGISRPTGRSGRTAF